MIELKDFFLILGGAIVGFLVCYAIMLRTHLTLKKNLIAHETRQALEKELEEKSKADKDAMMQNFRDSFSALSSQALRDNNEEFLKLARENFSKQQNTAESRLNE